MLLLVRTLEAVCVAALVLMATAIVAILAVRGTEGCSDLYSGTLDCSSWLMTALGRYGRAVYELQSAAAIPTALAVAGLGVLSRRGLRRLQGR